MSTNIFNRDDGNKVLSYAQIDKDFDHYWENEARNPVRNRIRIGRQYQAAVPALLKPNEIDKYKNEEREILKWKPNNELNEQQLQQYLQLAKAVSMFSKVVIKNENSTTAINNKTTIDNETGNDNQQTTTIKNETKNDDEKIDKNELNNLDVLNKFKLIFKSLSQFVNAHHPLQPNSNCKLLKANTELTSTEFDELNNLSNNRNWTEKECILITSALQVCFKNFPSIKQEFLPFKSTKNIIDYYNLCLNQDNNLQTDDDKLNQIEDETKKCNELRNKLDARSADGKDTNLEQCSAILNQFINDLMKVNENKGSNIRNQTNNNEDSDKDDDKDNLNNSSNNSNTITKTNSRTMNNSRTNLKNSTNNEIKDTKEHNEKKNSKNNFKLNSDHKRTSLRPSTLNNSKNNQSNKLIKPINQSQIKTNNQTTNKTEPKDEYEFDDQLEESDCNSLGSLKFYKDGQLVLKLNAKQPAVNNKVQWEESTDSELIKLKRNLKKKKFELNKSKKPFELNGKSKTTNEDQDDSSSFESDDNEDSRTSSESSNLQNSFTMNGLFNKKAKVKVENYLPLPSTKEDYLELNNNNDFINKLINNEDNLKRKLPSTQRCSPKNVNLKKNKILKSNSLTNSSTQLIDQLNILSSLPIDLRQKLLEQNTNDILDFQKNVNSLNLLANLNNLNELTNINQEQLKQQNNLNFNNLLSSFNNSTISANTFESIDSIKMRNQIECLMSNLNNLIEAEQLK